MLNLMKIKIEIKENNNEVEEVILNSSEKESNDIFNELYSDDNESSNNSDKDNIGEKKIIKYKKRKLKKR